MYRRLRVKGKGSWKQFILSWTWKDWMNVFSTLAYDSAFNFQNCSKKFTVKQHIPTTYIVQLTFYYTILSHINLTVNSSVTIYPSLFGTHFKVNNWYQYTAPELVWYAYHGLESNVLGHFSFDVKFMCNEIHKY